MAFQSYKRWLSKQPCGRYQDSGSKGAWEPVVVRGRDSRFIQSRAGCVCSQKKKLTKAMKSAFNRTVFYLLIQ